jgi:hypothetical protein
MSSPPDSNAPYWAETIPMSTPFDPALLMPRLLNLTPHCLMIHTPDGVVTLPRPGAVARVATVSVPAAPVGAIPTCLTSLGHITDLPDPQPGVILIVSGMVAAAAPRADIMSPGDLVRDEAGRAIGCRGLRRSC